MTAPTAYRLTDPTGGRTTWGDGLHAAYDFGPNSVPVTWFIDGTGYVAADHPRAPYYLSLAVFAAEPVDEIPQAYKDESARLTRAPFNHLGPPTVDAAG